MEEGLVLYRGMFEFGAVTRRGNASPVCWCAVMTAALAAVLVFVSVNQVLVRLWARVIQISVVGLKAGPVVRPRV